MYFLASLLTIANLVAAGVALFHWKYRYRRGSRLGAILLILMLFPLWYFAPGFAHEEHQHAAAVAERTSLVERGASFADVTRRETRETLDRIVRQPDALGGAWFLAAESVNVRRSPERTSRRVGTLSLHESVWVPGRAMRRGDWIQITKPHQGWVSEKYLVLPSTQGQAGLIGWNQRPYYPIRNGNVRAAPSPEARVTGVVKPGDKCVRVEQKGFWIRVRKDNMLGWVHASNLRLAKTTEADAAYLSAARFSLRYAFPEETLLGKVLGVAVGVLIGLATSVVLPRWKMSDNMLIAKLFVTILYFAIKNTAVLRRMSANELAAMTFSAGVLGVFVELFCNSVVEHIRGA